MSQKVMGLKLLVKYYSKSILVPRPLPPLVFDHLPTACILQAIKDGSKIFVSQARPTSASFTEGTWLVQLVKA